MSAETPSVSIALATYNGERFLARQLDSLAAQQLLPAELVVTDDRSTDGTVAIVEGFARTAPFPVRLEVNPERLGYRANFMKAAGLCSADLIFFCDQDDFWLPAKTATIAAAFADPAVLLAYHNAAVVDADERQYDVLYDAAQQAALLAEAPAPPWHYSLGFTQAFRRELLGYDDLWALSRDHNADAVMAHDQWYFALALALGRVAYVDAQLARYRQHGANTYGAGLKTGAFRRLVGKLSHQPGWDAGAGPAAEQRALVLSRVAERTMPPQRQRVEDIAGRYAALAQGMSRRQTAYCARSLGARIGAFARSVRARDYGTPPWRFDWRTMPRDLVGSVIGRRSGGG